MFQRVSHAKAQARSKIQVSQFRQELAASVYCQMVGGGREEE